MNWGDTQLLNRTLPSDQGPGNALLLTFGHDHVTEVFTVFGEKSVSAENVARHVVQCARRYLSSRAAVGEYMPVRFDFGQRDGVDCCTIAPR